MNYSEDVMRSHRVYTEYSQKRYWTKAEGEGHLIAGDATNCTRVELCPRYGGGYPMFTFEMPRQRHELEKMERLMLECYERGKIDRGIAIGKMVKGLIAL